MENTCVLFAAVIPFPTVVRTPQFYYHLTTIDGIDLPHFAVVCFFRDLSQRELIRPARHSAAAECRFFIVEKSVVMVYNKLLNFAGVTGSSWQAGFLFVR